jgi:hypothetical protein
MKLLYLTIARKPSKRGLVQAAGILVIPLALSVTACSNTAPGGNGYAVENVNSGEISTHYQQIQPPYTPTGKSVYRENLNDAEASQVLGLNTTTFFFQQGRTDPFFWCPSRGGAVPNTAQLTDPQYVEPDPNASAGSVIISNIDPNGVYAPAASNGTYVSCYTASGVVYQVYSEPDVVQLSAPATWSYTANNGHGGIVVTGAPVMPVCSVQYVNQKQSDDSFKQVAETVCTAPPGGTTPVVK